MSDTSFLKWPFFEKRHEQLQAELDAWAQRELSDVHVDHANVDRACRDLVKGLGQAGFLRHTVPAAYGGQGATLDVRSLCLARETLARHLGLADFAFAMQGLGSGAITLFGTEELRRAYLPKVASGDKIAAFALSEGKAGSDVAAMATTAEQDGDSYVLNGSKTWISNAGIADFYTVFARTGEAPGARGLSAFVVDADTPGLTVSDRIDIIAPHPLGTLTFDHCRIPATRRLGTAGKGFNIAMATLDVFRSTVGAAALGFARHALEATLTHAEQRELFGAPMSSLQMVQGMLADMALQVDAAALLVYRAAWTKDNAAERVTREAAMAKLYATEAAQKVIDTAVQLHGGLGVSSGHPMEDLYREIRALRIYEGASEIQKIVIARQALADHRHREQQDATGAR